MTTCIACAKWSPKRVLPERAREGFGHCELRIKGIIHDGLMERDCEDFRAEAADVVEGRRRWLEQQGAKV